jgi:hypothetical protein
MRCGLSRRVDNRSAWLAVVICGKAAEGADVRAGGGGGEGGEGGNGGSVRAAGTGVCGSSVMVEGSNCVWNWRIGLPDVGSTI